MELPRSTTLQPRAPCCASRAHTNLSWPSSSDTHPDPSCCLRRYTGESPAPLVCDRRRALRQRGVTRRRPLRPRSVAFRRGTTLPTDAALGDGFASSRHEAPWRRARRAVPRARASRTPRRTLELSGLTTDAATAAVLGGSTAPRVSGVLDPSLLTVGACPYTGSWRVCCVCSTSQRSGTATAWVEAPPQRAPGMDECCRVQQSASVPRAAWRLTPHPDSGR